MTSSDDFQDRVAARLLGVALDADPCEVRSRFRRLARAVHPDAAVGVACADLGRLAEAKDRLLARAARADAARTRQEEERRLRREEAARRRVEAMRATPAESVSQPREEIVGSGADLGEAAAGRPFTGARRAFQPFDRVGRRFDVAC